MHYHYHPSLHQACTSKHIAYCVLHCLKHTVLFHAQCGVLCVDGPLSIYLGHVSISWSGSETMAQRGNDLTFTDSRIARLHRSTQQQEEDNGKWNEAQRWGRVVPACPSGPPSTAQSQVTSPFHCPHWVTSHYPNFSQVALSPLTSQVTAPVSVRHHPDSCDLSLPLQPAPSRGADLF